MNICDFNPAISMHKKEETCSLHSLLCSKSCSEEFHIEKGYSNRLTNFFTKEELFQLEDGIKNYISMVESIFDQSFI